MHEPDRPAGSWGFGAGTVHHIALWGADVDALKRQKEIYEELGFTDASEIKDRFYFNSMYCRAPGGILVESCCNQAEGFLRDETPDRLGQKLHLPPWWENRKEEMMAHLEPITVPETAMVRS
jgi:glyoxalase family protein